MRPDGDLMAAVSILSASMRHDTGPMDFTMKRIIVPSLIFLSLLGVSHPAFADDDDERDHEIARKAMIEGRIRPLTEIIDGLKAEFPGQIIGVELEVQKNGTFNYEFKVLTADGKLKEVKVDAATAKILTIEDDD